MTQTTHSLDFWRGATRRQFHAAIDMLANAIEACPDSLWTTGGGEAPFWHLAFHTLFFVDLYLAGVDEPEFRSPTPFGLTELEDGVMPERAYTKDELRAYVAHCRQRLDAAMAEMTEAWIVAPCPIPFRAMSNGELLLYNMRHVQHHAAQLNLMLRRETGSAPDWVSKGPTVA